jgi:tRNA C32,U32 (ribose-2'-O)-methylase TrmJ
MYLRATRDLEDAQREIEQLKVECQQLESILAETQYREERRKNILKEALDHLYASETMWDGHLREVDVLIQKVLKKN